jgi:hypothetical protein
MKEETLQSAIEFYETLFIQQKLLCTLRALRLVDEGYTTNKREAIALALGFEEKLSPKPISFDEFCNKNGRALCKEISDSIYVMLFGGYTGSDPLGDTPRKAIEEELGYKLKDIVNPNVLENMSKSEVYDIYKALVLNGHIG